MNDLGRALLRRLDQVAVRTTLRILDVGFLVGVIGEDLVVEVGALVTGRALWRVEPRRDIVAGRLAVARSRCCRCCRSGARSDGGHTAAAHEGHEVACQVLHDLGADSCFDGTCRLDGAIHPCQRLEHDPEVEALLRGLHQRRAHQDPTQALLAIHCPDVGEQALPLVLVQLNEFVQWHHVVVPTVGGSDAEMLAEAALSDGEVHEGHGHFHLHLATILLVGQLVRRPVLIQGGVHVEVEALRRGLAGVGIVAEQRIGARLHGKLALTMAGVVGDAVFGLTRGVKGEQRGAPGHQASDEAFDHVTRVGDGALHDIRRAVRHADEANLLADLLLALLCLAILGHVGDLPDEAGCARLTTGV